MNPFDPYSVSPLGLLAMRIRPCPEPFPERPPSPADAEALIERLASAPGQLREAAMASEEASVSAVLESGLYWESWLEYGLGQLASGGRLKLGGNVIIRVSDDRSTAGLLDHLARGRAANVAELRGRGPALWDQRAIGTDEAGMAAYPLLSALAANDAERVALLREAGAC
jgi:hypothetical protein